MGHSDNRITEKPVSSISKGTGVNGVGSSEPTRQRVRRGDEPLQTPLTPVPSCCLPLYIITTDSKGLPVGRRNLGAESSEPVSPVAQATPKAEPHSERSEASPSLDLSRPNAHTHYIIGGKRKGRGEGPCGGYLREICRHGNVRYKPLKCHRWDCEYCAPGKVMELLERLQGALTEAWAHGWTLKFVTLTYGEDVTKEQVRLHLAHLVQAIRRKYGYCEYAKVPEWTQNGRIHLHLAMIMPFIPQKELSNMWRRFAGAPSVWITAVRGVGPLGTELSKQQIAVRQLTNYLSKGPAGKVTYSRHFPEAEPLVVVKPGPCDACGGLEHIFMHLSSAEAEKSFPHEVAGREMPGLAVRPTGKLAADCGCWPDPGGGEYP